MISLSTNVEQWCLHKAGRNKLLNSGRLVSDNASVELNEDGVKIISSFGENEFDALVGFVDMQGFSLRCFGKRPAEVHEIAAPFVSAVTDVAREHSCFIDKTIGDEVMIVMPWFDEDSTLSDAMLPHRNVHVYELQSLLLDLIKKLEDCAPTVKFTAGFAFGSLILARVGGRKYGEWTVYGTCVNAAKRLQSRAPKNEWSGYHILAAGQLIAEPSSFRHAMQSCVSSRIPHDPLRFLFPESGTEEFKGVGPIAYFQSAIEPANTNPKAPPPDE